MIMQRALLLAAYGECALAFSVFPGLLPNGNSAVGCDGSTVRAVGHADPRGGGPRNQFGLDFRSAGYAWTSELCNQDSDGDGMSNGQELGDPACVWTPGTVPSRTEDISHPGQSCAASSTPGNPAPVPTPAPTPPTTGGQCCFGSGCSSCNGAGEWCSSSASACEGSCGGTYCSQGSSQHEASLRTVTKHE